VSVSSTNRYVCCVFEGKAVGTKFLFNFTVSFFGATNPLFHNNCCFKSIADSLEIGFDDRKKRTMFCKLSYFIIGPENYWKWERVDCIATYDKVCCQRLTVRKQRGSISHCTAMSTSTCLVQQNSLLPTQLALVYKTITLPFAVTLHTKIVSGYSDRQTLVTTVKSTSFFECFREISRLRFASILLRWFKLARIYIHVPTLYNGADSLLTPIVESTYLLVRNRHSSHAFTGTLEHAH